MTAIDISDQFIANSPTTLSVTPGKSGLRIRGTQSVITTLGTPLTLTKQANRNMRWRQTTRDVAALIAGGQMAYTTDTPTYTSISGGGSVANNNSSTLVITGTRFEGDAKVYLVPAVGSSIEATVTARTSTTGITFKVPLAVPTGTYSLHITDTQYHSLTVTNAVTVTGMALTNSTSSVANDDTTTCTLTGTDIRAGLLVTITDADGVTTAATNIIRIGATSATFTIPGDCQVGVGTINVHNVGTPDIISRAITVTGLTISNSTASVNNNNTATCTLTGTDIRSNLQVTITDVDNIDTYADNVIVVSPTSATFTVPVSVAPGVGTIAINNDGVLPVVTRAITIT